MVPVQTHSPLTGATPATVIIDGAWQVTPQATSCILSHANTVGRQDLIIKAAAGDAQLAVGLPLFNGTTYAAPAQLTISAQAGTAQPIGRLTFRPVVGGSGTLLTAGWPADQLLPHLQTAERLNFFGPDRRLIRSVRLLGGTGAVTSLRRCLDALSSVRPGPSSEPPPPNDSAAYGDWQPMFRPGVCAISHMTTTGNAVSLLLQRDGKLDVVYRFARKARSRGAEVVAVNFILRKVGDASVPARSGDGGVAILMGKPGDHVVLIGLLDPGILSQMKMQRWDFLQLDAHDEHTKIHDKVELFGAAAGVRDLEKCVQR